MSEQKRSPVILVVLDGWGIASDWGGNAISLAKTPTMHQFWRDFPHAQLQASGEAVGLPLNIMGNSEVGHINIGAGKVVKQFLPLINDQIETHEFFKNPTLLKAMDKVKTSGKKLHLLGVFSNGSVHGHIHHLFALLQMAKNVGVEDVIIHAFTDGRDTEPTSALTFYEKTNTFIKGLHSNARFGTITGRFFAMDRDNRWERTATTYNALVHGQGAVFNSAGEAISAAYRDGKIDEFIEPCIIRDKKLPDGIIADGDVVISYNFRADRMRQLIQALAGMDVKMDRGAHPPKVDIVTFTEYQSSLPVEVAFHPDPVNKSLSDVVAESGLPQFHIAETEKYAHVTYFFNGGVESPVSQEVRLLIPSPKVATYDKTPEMSAKEITKVVIDKLKSEKFQLFVVNYANADMVGHTGNIRATITAVETIDTCLQQVWAEVQKVHGTLIITADHGNAEQMINPETGLPDTEHTKNPVPFIVVSANQDVAHIELKSSGVLANVAPTVLDIMHLEKPSTMTMESLVLH